MALTRPRYSQIYDTDYKQSVKVATTSDVGNLILANTQPNVVDGITLTTLSRVLVKNQSDPTQNGIYEVRSVGTGSNGWWTRSLDANQNGFVTSGMTTIVSEGDINASKTFRLITIDPIYIGNTALNFTNPFEVTASAGGANTYVQFNDVSQLGGTPGFTFIKYSNTVSISGGIITGNIVANALTISGNILPGANIAYDLGSPTKRWRTGYFSSNTIDLGGSQISVGPNGFSFNSAGTTTTIASNGSITSNTLTAPVTTITGNLIVGNAYVTTSIGDVIYFDRGQNFIGFNDTSPDFLYDFNAPSSGGELLHIETGVGTQAWFGAQNYGGLRYAAGVDQDYVFSGSHDRPDHYVLMTAGMVRANIHGHTGNVIFSNSISVTNDVSTKYLGTQEFRATSSNITVRSDVTLLGTKLFGAGQLAIGTEDIGAEKLFVTGGETYLDGDVTVAGNLFVNGNVTTLNANNLSINDSLIYLADDNPADTIDTGFVGSFTNPGYQHTGIVRDASDGRWKFFSNVVAEPTTTVDFTDAKYDTIQIGNIYAGSGVGSAGTYLSQTGSGLSWVALSANKINQNASNVTVTESYVNVAVNGSNVASFGSTNLIVGNILPTANNVSNIGSATSKFRIIHAQATQAQYADLAEVYTSDQQYPAGTVVIFGGMQEVTQSRDSHDTRIAGVISTDPAYLMNAMETGVPVALQGRVPCRVLGPIEQGDRVVSSHIPGVAQKLSMMHYQPGCIIGKALQAIDSTDISIIEVVVGRI